MISTSITNNSATIVISNSTGNKVYTINSGDTIFNSVIDAIRKQDEKLIIELCDKEKSSIAQFVEGDVSVKNGHVYYKNVQLNNVIVDRIFGFIKNKLSPIPLLKFINKLMNNPSSRAVKELYKFLEHKNLPVTPSGNFLAYKGLNNDFYSIHGGNIRLLKGKVNSSGQIFNGVGEEIECERNEVCDDKEIGCADGLHAGSLSYAKGFSRGKMVIVEINPMDVVSVPLDCECQKLRVCHYTVVGEYSAPLDDNYCQDFNSNSDINPTDDYINPTDDYYDPNLEEEFDAEQDAYDAGYTDGYNDAVENGKFDSNCAHDYGEYEDIFKEGYQSGYNAGLIDSFLDNDK